MLIQEIELFFSEVHVRYISPKIELFLRDASN